MSVNHFEENIHCLLREIIITNILPVDVGLHK